MNKDEFKIHINKLRKANKGQWVFASLIVENKEVQFKAFNTYIQIFKVDGIRYGGRMDINVKEFNQELDKPFNNANV